MGLSRLSRRCEGKTRHTRNAEGSNAVRADRAHSVGPNHYGDSDAANDAAAEAAHDIRHASYGFGNDTLSASHVFSTPRFLQFGVKR